MAKCHLSELVSIVTMTRRSRYSLRLPSNMTTYWNRRNSARPSILSNSNTLSVVLRIINFYITILLQKLYSQRTVSTKRKLIANLCVALFSLSYCMYYDLAETVFAADKLPEIRPWTRTNINNYTETECLFYFRFTSLQLHTIIYYFDFPKEIQNSNGCVFKSVRFYFIIAKY